MRKVLYYICLLIACVIVLLCVIVGALVLFKAATSAVKDGG